MANYFEFDNTIIFHPGYYIEELLDESGMAKADFAKSLEIKTESLELLIQGEQNLSQELAVKLSKMTGTSIAYWLNLQKSYDKGRAKICKDKKEE